MMRRAASTLLRQARVAHRAVATTQAAAPLGAAEARGFAPIARGFHTSNIAGAGISAQELQQRLEREGVSYTELLSRFRAEASVHLLKDRCLTVSEIAFKLGYAKPATFYHEFRRWRRVTPAQFRDQNS